MYQHSSDKDPNEVIAWLNSERGITWGKHNFGGYGSSELTRTNYIYDIKDDPVDDWDLGSMYVTHFIIDDINAYGELTEQTPELGWQPDKPPERV